MNTNVPLVDPVDASLAEGLRPPVDAMSITSWWHGVLWVGLALLLVALAATALLLWWRARQRRRNQPSPPPRVVPPHERAFRHLDDALHLLSDPDRFCTEVSRVLRTYLEERFGWNAPDRTTEEFLSELRHRQGLSTDLRLLLEDFLTRCDLVKFARHDPTETELRQLHGAAHRLVSETMPSLTSLNPDPAPSPAPPTAAP